MSLRPRSRTSFAAAAISVAALLGLAIAPPANAADVVIVPTPEGTNVKVSATVDGTYMESTYGEVTVAGDTYLETVARADYDLSQFDATSQFVYVVSSSADWTNSSITTCLSYNPAAVQGDPAFFVRIYDWDTDTYSWIDRTVDIPSPGTICGIDNWATYSGEYVLGFTPTPFVPGFPVITDAFEVSLDTVVATNVFGDDLDALAVNFRFVNHSDDTLTVGLALDLAVPGVMQKLWLPEGWGAGPPQTELFAFSIAPGDEFDDNLPSWPGKTYGLYLISSDPEGEFLGDYTAPGRPVPVVFVESGFLVKIGTEATVTGGTPPDLFPGVTASVQASNLTPGEHLQFWMAPGLDYFWFYLISATLPSDAVYVGSGTVGPGGTLSSTFDLPSTTAYGSYQLLVGDPAERYWPAGSSESFQVQFPASSNSAPTPQSVGPSAVSVSVPLSATVVDLLFPNVASAGQTTVAASTTGPATNTFVLAGSPPIYYHIDTTATFNGSVQVCITYDPATLTGGIPYLYHYKQLGPNSYQWQPITTSRTTGKVCGLTDSFSPFALGYPLTTDVILTNKDQCKNGGWATSTLPIFKNQGDCVSYFASQGKSKGK